MFGKKKFSLVLQISFFRIMKKSNLNPLAKEFVMGKGREQVSILLEIGRH